MRKTSIIIFIVGVIFTIGCIIYFRSVLNVVDSDSMTIDRSGAKVSSWPLFVGIYTTFVGAVFFYASGTDKRANYYKKIKA
jgi:hypothetical protein